MKKLWFGLIGVVASTPAFCDWTEVGGNDELTFFADVATRDSVGANRRMWTLVDLKGERRVGAVAFSSVKTRFEFDCAGQRARELAADFFAGKRADGEKVFGYSEPGAWESIREGTLKDGLAKIACEEPTPATPAAPAAPAASSPTT